MSCTIWSARRFGVSGPDCGVCRCHSHKFDPIPQTDYYAMKAVFEGVVHGERDIALPMTPENQNRIDDLTRQIAALDAQLREFETLASLRATSFIRPTDNSRRTRFRPCPRPRSPRANSAELRSITARVACGRNLSSGYLYWKVVPGTDVFLWKPQLKGKYRFWTSWGCGHKSHTTDARYLLDRDGNPETKEDQQEFLRANHQRFADESDLIPEQPLWSGLKDGGVLDLTPESTILLRQGDQGSYVTVDVAVFQAASDVIEDRPALRVPVTRDLNVERFPPTTAKHVRFTINMTSDVEPCIDELEVFGRARTAGELTNVALASTGTKATASGTYPNSDIHKLEHINDGIYGNSKSWISNELARAGSSSSSRSCARSARFAGAATGRLLRSTVTVWPPNYVIETSWTVRSGLGSPFSGDRLPFGTAVPGGRLIRAEGTDARQRFEELQQQRVKLAKELAPLVERPKAYAGTFVSPPPTVRLNRGDVTQPREVVAPASLSELGTPVQLKEDAPEAQRRLALADWIVSREHPLTARVIVNRLWLQHFGEGIVDTPSDFGANGGKPTHPELLDWLAMELMEGPSPPTTNQEPRTKNSSDPGPSSTFTVSSACPRLIANRVAREMTASQSTQAVGCFGGYPPRRLEAESIRDAILAVSGQLDLRAGGPGFDLFEPNTNYVKVYNSKRDFTRDDFRRMIYQKKTPYAARGYIRDVRLPRCGAGHPQRSSSTTALQALSLLNSPFLLQQSQAFARSDRAIGRLGRHPDHSGV